MILTCVTSVVSTLLLVGLVSSSTLQSRPDGFTHNAVLDDEGNYHLYWKTDEVTITFEVRVRTTGWVGFGFSPNGGMPGSDIVMGWVLENGDVRFTDRHSNSFAEPIIDDSRDYTLLMGKEENDVTMLRFERKLDTCDDDHDWLITDDTMRVIWAYHSDDPTENDHVLKHEHRGTRSIHLLSKEGLPDLDGPNMFHYDLVVDKFEVPVQKTTYVCVGQKLPELTEKHHLVAYEPIIEDGHEGIVHHVLIYQCTAPIDDDRHQKAHECYTPNMPDDLRSCTTVVMGWAVGGGVFHFPDNAGMSLGQDGDPKYFMFEMHYDNPDLLEGIIDNSGMRIHYTPTLRQYDSGALSIGLFNTMLLAIPPRAEKFSYKSFCSQPLTSEGLFNEDEEATNFTTFAVFLHSHLLGRQIQFSHIRDGKEINVVADNHYDFNYQEIRKLRQEIVIQPGDELIAECVYDSTARQGVTYFGFGTTDEMCIAILFMYPRPKMSVCFSALKVNESAAAIGVEELNMNVDPPVIKSPSKWQNMTVREVMDEYDWDNESTTNLQRAAHSGSFFSMAFGGFTNFWRKPLSHFPITVNSPLPAPQRHCEKPTSEAHVRRSSYVTTIIIPSMLAIIRFMYDVPDVLN